MLKLSRIVLALGVVSLAGCPAPWIRGPSLYPTDPAAERASYTLNDPLPDSSLGPNVSSRPREAVTQRSEPRRTTEAAIRSMNAVPVPGGAPQMIMPPPGGYPETVAP